MGWQRSHSTLAVHVSAAGANEIQNVEALTYEEGEAVAEGMESLVEQIADEVIPQDANNESGSDE